MDLTQFTSPKKKEKKQNKEIVVDTSDILIEKLGDKLWFTCKTKKALDKYQDFLFMAPTHSLIPKTDSEAEKFFKSSLDEGVEGVMMKNLDSSYSSGLRVGAMAKLKETKEDIDVVVIAAERGRGKRAGFYSSFLIAVRNDEYEGEGDEEFLLVGKVSSGIKELGEEGASLENLTRLLTPLKTHEKKDLVYVEPKIVLQVRYQEVQVSQTYSSGLALRFPRIIFLREDKPLDEINTLSDLKRFIKN